MEFYLLKEERYIKGPNYTETRVFNAPRTTSSLRNTVPSRSETRTKQSYQQVLAAVFWQTGSHATFELSLVVV